jgi:hypothetical protein
MKFLILLLLLTSPMAGSTSELSTEHICVDIARQINDSVDRGELTKSQAEYLIPRCYKAFKE